MGGFENDVMVAKNLNFDGAAPKPHLGILNVAGKLPIGTGNSSPTPEILGGLITSPLGTLVVGYSSPNITMDIVGGTSPIQTLTVDSAQVLTPSGSPNNITLTGLVVANATHAKAVFLTKTASSTGTIDVQLGSAIAAGDVTKVGLVAMNSAQFTVSAAGFVSATGTIPIQFTADSGTATPAAGNLNVLGLSGSKTSASGSTLTVKSPPFSQVGASATSSLNSGEFVTAAVTRTLPASAGLADGDLFAYVCTTAGALVIQAVGTQKIRIGASISSAAGTCTSTAIGNAICLRFDATDGFFYAVPGTQGNWTLA